MNSILEREAPRCAGALADVSVAVVQSEAELRELEEEWNSLFAACKRPSLCGTYAWASAWWEAFGGNPGGAGRRTRLFVVVARDAERRLVGIVPFFEEFESGLFQVRRLRILGYLGGGEPFDMTEEPIVLVRPGWDDPVFARLAGILRDELRTGRWDAIHFRLHSEETSPLKRLFGTFRSLAFVFENSRSGSDYADIPATWSDYRRAMTKSMRDNLGYYPRLLTRDGHDWAVRIRRTPEEMPEAVARLAELHRARARSEKGALHNDHLQGPVQEAFLTGLLSRLAAAEEGYVAELVVGGEVVASQAFVEVGDHLMVSYSGYLEAWYRYSPIFVIDAAVFQQAQERGVRRIDFLRNIAPWKTRWLAQPGSAMHRAVVVPYRPTALARIAIHGARATFKRNVLDRGPVLRRRLVARMREVRANVERVFVSSACAFHRAGDRMAPAVHWTMLHHRTLVQVAVHRHG